MKWLLLFLPLTLCGQPALPSLDFRWDYPGTAPRATFLLLGGPQVIPTTNTSATASNVPPGLYQFKAAATNESGGATSAPVAVRVVRMTVEKSDNLNGPWSTDTLWFRSYTLTPSNGFLRLRLDWQ